MKVFEHQTLPSVDDIWWYWRSNVAYKIMTSAAFLYNHPIARAETYAAYRVLNEKIAFQGQWINTRWGSTPKFRLAPCSLSARS